MNSTMVKSTEVSDVLADAGVARCSLVWVFGENVPRNVNVAKRAVRGLWHFSNTLPTPLKLSGLLHRPDDVGVAVCSGGPVLARKVSMHVYTATTRVREIRHFNDALWEALSLTEAMHRPADVGVAVCSGGPHLAGLPLGGKSLYARV